MSLEPIFNSPDIQKQLPDEARTFKEVEKGWGTIMRKANENANAMRQATQPGLLEQLIEYNGLLEQVGHAQIGSPTLGLTPPN